MSEPPVIAPGLRELRPRAMLRAMLHQPFAVWGIFVYIFFEYVRPQTIYPALDVFPFARFALIGSVVGSIFMAGTSRKWTFIDTAMVLFSTAVFASLITAFRPEVGTAQLGLYLSWLAVYWVLARSISTLTRVILLLVGYFLWNLKMSLFALRSWAAIGFGFDSWGIGGAPGWFENSGEFGIQMCMVFPLSLYFALGVRDKISKPYFIALLVLPATAVAGTAASGSRGALLGVAAVGLWMLVRSRYKLRGLVALAGFVALLAAVVPPEQKTRLLESGDDATSQSRITYWKRGLEIARAYPLLGVGYKNWSVYNAYTWSGGETGTERLGLPHNIFIECVAELGYMGLLALLLLVGGTFWLNAKTRRLARRLGENGRIAVHLGWGFDGALVGYVVSGFFVTVLYYPYLWVNLGMTVALHASVARAALRGGRWNGSRGRRPDVISPGSPRPDILPSHA